MTCPQLSEGVIKKILNGDEVQNAVLQILGYKKVPGNQNDRYRLLISDGIFAYSYALLATQMAHLISSRNLEKFTIVKIKHYVCTRVKPEKIIIIITELDIISSANGVGERIGNPTPIESGNVPHFVSFVSPDSSGTPSTSFSSDSTPRLELQGHGTVSTSPRPEPIVHPINSVSPYKTWTIRARVTNKSSVREFCNSRSAGKFFIIDFVDESGEIRATVFNECVDRFYDLIEVDKVYYVSKAKMKRAQKKFTSINNYYELHFSDDTTVVPCEGNFDDIPSLQFNFIPIAEVDQAGTDSIVDIIGVCRSTQDVETVLSRRSSTELKKRDVRLVDSTNSEILLTLWGDSAENFDGSSNPVVALKGVKISDFRFRSLSALLSTVICINPDIRDAHVLRQWFETEGRHMEQFVSQSISSSSVCRKWKTLAQAKDDMKGMVCESEFYKAKASIVIAERGNCMYMGCPSDGCCKKVNDLNNGKYECTKCGLQYDCFKWTFLLRISIADFSEDEWVTCFDQTAEVLLNKTAHELQALRESNEGAFDDVFSKISFESYIFDVRTKLEMYNEENRLKTTVITASPINHVSYAQKLMCDIRQMEDVL